MELGSVWRIFLMIKISVMGRITGITNWWWPPTEKQHDHCHVKSWSLTRKYIIALFDRSKCCSIFHYLSWTREKNIYFRNTEHNTMEQCLQSCPQLIFVWSSRTVQFTRYVKRSRKLILSWSWVGSGSPVWRRNFSNNSIYVIFLGR